MISTQQEIEEMLSEGRVIVLFLELISHKDFNLLSFGRNIIEIGVDNTIHTFRYAKKLLKQSYVIWLEKPDGVGFVVDSVEIGVVSTHPVTLISGFYSRLLSEKSKGNTDNVKA